MNPLLDTIVADSLARPLPDLTRRDARLWPVPGKADVVVGMRRAGKTWFVFQCMRDLLDAGLPRARMLYVDFDDERLLPMDAASLAALPEALYRRHPEVQDGERWFLFDEIQNVDGWERVIRRLVEEPDVRVVLTGSSSRLLSREIATSLRGRSVATELSPFTFAETARHRGIDRPAEWPPPVRERRRLSALLDQYLAVGGFPEVQDLDPETRVRVLQEYIDVALYRDVVERHGVTNVTALRWLVRRLVAAPGGRFTVNRFYNDVRSQGLSVGKDTLHELYQHLADAFLVHEVTIYAKSERRRRVNPRKVYLADHALSSAFSFQDERDRGHKLENVVCHVLRRGGARVSYYETRSDREVDFVVERRDAPPRLVQVSADLSDPDTRDREMRALDEAMGELGLDEGEVVTAGSDEDRVRTTHGSVRVVPAWRWLLEDEGR